MRKCTVEKERDRPPLGEGQTKGQGKRGRGRAEVGSVEDATRLRISPIRFLERRTEVVGMETDVELVDEVDADNGNGGD